MRNNSMRGSVAFGLNPSSRLWKPVQVGAATINHRVSLPACTRMRSPQHLPAPFVATFYEQRSSGGLMVSEATLIAKEAGGYPNTPGIWSHEQVSIWRDIVKGVHAKGSVFYCQLWALGRANGGYEPDVKCVGPSDIPLSTSKKGKPEQMTLEDIDRYLNHYRTAAQNAMEAGFDGCEIHGSNGYLVDQFLQASCNSVRQDKYGGSLENRARFLLDAIQVVADTIGQEKTSIRLSPFSPYQDMGKEDDPFETWGYVCNEISIRFPKLAYISIVDPRLGSEELGLGVDASKHYSVDKFRAIFRGLDPADFSKLKDQSNTKFPEPDSDHPTVFVSAGGYKASDAEEASERTGDVIGFGRIFIANPDLPHRLKNGLELNAYDRATFYSRTEKGYTTYPFANADTKRFE